MHQLFRAPLAFAVAAIFATEPSVAQTRDLIGRELSGYDRLAEGDESRIPLSELLERGRRAFEAQWTPQEGGGRPRTNGVGREIADLSRPLTFPFNFNRVSAMDSNGCAGCHNAPFGIPGGGGDFVTGVFVAAQRFDFASFDRSDPTPLRGSVNETGADVRLDTIGNLRATPGMFGSGYIEMLSRQMTADLQAARDALEAGGSVALETKGIRFGTLRRAADGSWDVGGVEGLPENSLASEDGPPSLIIRPFHQSGSVVSLREFTNNAFNHHHGIQSSERFGSGTDPDGDGRADELGRADVTAVAVFQATLAVPGQVVPNDLAVEEAIYQGERLFDQIGCASCHVPKLPLVDQGWVFTEPNPYNPEGNMQPGDGPSLSVDLTSDDLPGPRLRPDADGVVWTPAYTDLKLHDITTGAPDDPNRESVNINAPGGSAEFFAGNSRFLTKKLWGAANERPYFHHGKFTTLREATLAHFGEAEGTRSAFLALTGRQQDHVIEFLKSLQVLPPGSTATIVDENGAPKEGWPPASFFSWRISSGSR